MNNLVLTVGGSRWVLARVGDDRKFLAEGDIKGETFGADERSLQALEQAVKNIPSEELESCDNFTLRIPSRKLVEYINNFEEWGRRSDRVIKVQTRLALVLEGIGCTIGATFFNQARSKEAYSRAKGTMPELVVSEEPTGIEDVIQGLE